MDANEILDFNLEADHLIEVESVKTSKFILLYITSFGLYGVWWMYKAWQFYKEEENLDIMPAARAFFAIFFMWDLFTRILRIATSYGYAKTYSSGFLFVLILILNLTGRLPEPMWMISLFAFVGFLPPLEAFNYQIEAGDNYKLVLKNSLNTRQTVLVILGSLFWVLIFFGLFAIYVGY